MPRSTPSPARAARPARPATGAASPSRTVAGASPPAPDAPAPTRPTATRVRAAGRTRGAGGTGRSAGASGASGASGAGGAGGATPAAARGPARGAGLDTRFLDGLVGYNARRASIAIGEQFYVRMGPYGLKQAEFSVLILLSANPGVTSRQLCAALDILPPNFVRVIGALDRRGLIERRPHPQDGRAVGLYLTDDGHRLAAETSAVVGELERDVAADLTAAECATLVALLQKIRAGRAAAQDD